MAYCHYTSLSIMSLLTHGRHGINNDDGTSRIRVNVWSTTWIRSEVTVVVTRSTRWWLGYLRGHKVGLYLMKASLCPYKPTIRSLLRSVTTKIVSSTVLWNPTNEKTESNASCVHWCIKSTLDVHHSTWLTLNGSLTHSFRQNGDNRWIQSSTRPEVRRHRWLHQTSHSN